MKLWKKFVLSGIFFTICLGVISVVSKAYDLYIEPTLAVGQFSNPSNINNILMLRYAGASVQLLAILTFIVSLLLIWNSDKSKKEVEERKG